MSFFLYIHCRKASFACLLIERGKVMPRLLHHINDFVEGDTVDTVGEGGEDITVESTGCGKGIALYTRNLNKTTHWVTRHSQMMLQSHLSGILYLRRTASKQLACSRRGHGTSHTHLSLATYVCTGDRSIGLHYITHYSRSGNGMENLLIAEFMSTGKMI